MPSSRPSLVVLLLLLCSFLVLPLCQAGTWLSFNQNTGGLADRMRVSPDLRGKSMFEMAAGDEGSQLAGLLRMCRDKEKRSPGRAEHLSELCSALLQLSKEQPRKRRIGSVGYGGGPAAVRFVPVAMDEDLIWS